MFLKNDQNRSLERTLETIDIGNFENIGKRSNFFKIIVFACETHNALQLPVFYFFSFFLWLCQCYRNIDKFGAKNYFTDHRTANTMYPFRDLFPILKIHDCYWDTQKFEQPSIPDLHSYPTDSYKARTVCWCNQSTSNSFETVQTVYAYSNCMINQLLYCW